MRWYSPHPWRDQYGHFHELWEMGTDWLLRVVQLCESTGVINQFRVQVDRSEWARNRWKNRHDTERERRYYKRQAVFAELANRELARRRLDPQYRAFVSKIIHSFEERRTTALVFADWLQDNYGDNNLLARRLRLWASKPEMTGVVRVYDKRRNR